ncbi:MAG: iron ABC transporter permease [Lawsonibacter sp.]|nr:iron ABC transporter permease [Lawsonibacter sp.]
MKSLPTSYTRFRKRITILALAAAAACAAVASLCAGSTALPLSQVLAVLSGGGEGTARNIVLYVRLPRTLAALLCGAALAMGGAVIQGVLGNPLAGPNIIGVNAGAGLGAVLCSALLPASLTAVPIAAFAGALGACMLVYALARRTGASRITLVLAGVAISSMLSAGIDALSILFPDAALGANSFLIGRLSGVTLSALAAPAWLTALAGAGALAMSYELDLLSLGDEVAQSLGLSARSVRNILLTLAAVLCGAAVSFAGLVGFVGLLVPHAARFLVGSEHKYLLGASLFLGAALVTVCDLAGRVLFAPFELPVGILLSLMGGPFFLWLLFRQRGGRRP